MTSVVLTALLLTAPALPEPAQNPPVPAAKTPAGQEVVLEGELENYIVVGGETTGWRLRRRNAQGRREYIEVLLTAEVAQGVRANSRVQVFTPAGEFIQCWRWRVSSDNDHAVAFGGPSWITCVSAALNFCISS